jgi:hypothetical protein
VPAPRLAFMYNPPVMKTTPVLLLFILSFYFTTASPSAGFFLPDSVKEITFKYATIDNLIIIPAIINDSIHVRLILDTGCRNIVLFGKRFSKLIARSMSKDIIFSGLGNGPAAKGYVSVENNISINVVRGRRIPIVVVPQRNVFSNIREVDGVVGYEIFSKFEVRIDFPKNQITFRDGDQVNPKLADYTMIPLNIEEAQPIISAQIFYAEQDNPESLSLLIDTGSCLSLLITTKDKKRVSKCSAKILGRGLNGTISGLETSDIKLILADHELKNVKTAIIHSEHHDYASIGTDLLKNYILILNYAQGYAALQHQPEG